MKKLVIIYLMAVALSETILIYVTVTLHLLQCLRLAVFEFILNVYYSLGQSV